MIPSWLKKVLSSTVALFLAPIALLIMFIMTLGFTGPVLIPLIDYFKDDTKPALTEKAESKEALDKLLYGEDAVLLSIKYGLDEEKVLKLLADNPIIFKSPEDLRKFIQDYSQKSGIPPDKIASILLIQKKASGCTSAVDY